MFTTLRRRACRPSPDRGQPRPRRLGVEPLEDRSLPSSNVIFHWNELLLQSLPSQPPRVPLARNLALVHVAMFDAVNAIDRSYEPYAAHVHASHGASLEAAAAQAAHDTLTALYPPRQPIYDAALAEDLAGIPPGLAMQGTAVGREVARQILELRANDGSSAVVTYTPPNTDPGQWQPTYPDFSAAANAHVPLITPFAVQSSSQFRPGPPPALTSPEYAAAFNETKVVGAADAETADRDGNGLPDRTPDQTQVALLWRLPLTNHVVWNRIAQGVAEARGLTLAEDARLFALMDMAINDGLETSFGAKYHYTLWRPITAIRDARSDLINPDTHSEATWTTLHPSTPAYPTYSGNAATIGATCATVLADVLGSNDIPFEVHWDAYGFPGVTRQYSGFWAAADEEARSRIYGGIHFSFDSAAGQGVGRDVGGYIVDNFLLPREGPGASHGHPPRAATPAGSVPDMNRADGPSAIGAFGLIDGGESHLPTLFGGVPVDSQAQGRVRDNGPNVTATVITTTPDNGASGAAGADTGLGAGGIYIAPENAAIEADLASIEQPGSR
jgi:hypothetical protein